jgi:hypothetical protein
LEIPTEDSFMPGLELSRLFYEQAVRPILLDAFPRLDYAAALIGPGSEVLSFDTPQSTDHHWGPRVMLFLTERDHTRLKTNITRVLARQLPHEFMGYPTNYGPPDEIGVRLLVRSVAGPVNHRVELLTIRGFFSHYLGWDGSAEPTIEEWLTFSEHRLRAVAGGAAFSDPHGMLAQVRDRLTWYPLDLWLYLLAAEWNRIANEEAFVGRCGDVGDELGSRLVAARIVESVMRLCFLLERVYPPYSKWFGTGFAQLACAPTMEPLIGAVVHAEDWRAREAALASMYACVATLHNDAGLTDPLDTRVSPYFGRPYLVINAERFVTALMGAIDDERIRHLPVALGSVNQWVSSSNTREQPRFRDSLRSSYRP